MKRLEQLALSLVHKPYLWGGQNPLTGFDCSGLVVYLLRAARLINVHADYTAFGLFELLKRWECTTERKLGAVAFYGESMNLIKHCAFCLDDKWCIEARGDRTVQSFSDAMNYRSGEGAYVDLALIDGRKDFVCCLKPDYLDLEG